MSELGGFDVDLEAARAWSRFQNRLGDHLTAMADDDVLVLEVDSGTDYEEGCAPYVQFAAYDTSSVRAEVASNAFLAPERRIDDAGDEYLRTLGFTPPDASGPDEDGTPSSNYVLDAERSDGDRLAVMTVSALRRVFSVPHPIFLSASHLGDDDVAPDLGIPVPVREEALVAEMPDVVTPTSAEHLRELVDQALTPMFGNRPAKDDDGDIPVPHGSALVFVRVLEDQPVIEIFGFVVHGVIDLGAAEVEVAILNRDNRFIKFVVAGDAVVAVVQLPAYPFVPAHLRSLLPVMARTLDDIDDDLARRTGGHRSQEATRFTNPPRKPPSALPGRTSRLPDAIAPDGLGADDLGADDDAEAAGAADEAHQGLVPEQGVGPGDPRATGANDTASLGDGVDRLLDDIVSSAAQERARAADPDGEPDAGPQAGTPSAAGGAGGVPGPRADEPPGPNRPTPGVDGGEAAIEHSERVVGGLHPTLQKLVALDPRVDDLSGDEVAEMCGHDTQMLLRFLRTAGQQELDWRRFRDQAMLLGDTEEAAACDGEMSAWQRTNTMLRNGLRVVERERAGHAVGYEAVEPPRRRRWRPPRRHGDG